MNSVENLKHVVCEYIDSISQQLIEVSHRIHRYPELAFEEREAIACLNETFRAFDLIPTLGVYGLETAGELRIGTAEPTIAILSEYDALPGIGHACGHNIIASAGVGAVLALSQVIEDLPVSVRWLGTPAEERGCGKELLAQRGAFKGIDFAMMVHPAGVNTRGIRTWCLTEATIEYRGRAAHAAVNPHNGLNALDAAVVTYQAIAALRQHLDSNSMINSVIDSNRLAPNIIPDHAAIRLFVRTANGQSLNHLQQRIEACVLAGAKAAGCEYDMVWAEANYLDFKLNEVLAGVYQQNAEALGRDFFPLESLPPGASDMGNISHRVPSLHPLIACSPPSVVIHEPEFERHAGSAEGDLAVVDGAKLLAMTAIDIALDESLQQRARQEFDATADPSAEAVKLAFHNSSLRSGCC